jgi:hypothetical protein
VRRFNHQIFSHSSGGKKRRNGCFKKACLKKLAPRNLAETHGPASCVTVWVPNALKTRRAMQVLYFHIYCTLSILRSAPRLTVILAGTDIKTACMNVSRALQK